GAEGTARRSHDPRRAEVMASGGGPLIEPYLKRNLINRGLERPSRREILAEFARVWPEFTATIGVQEPWAGTIRFKWLVRLPLSEMDTFLEDLTGWIGGRYGGGKVQKNLDHRLQFLRT